MKQDPIIAAIEKNKQQPCMHTIKNQTKNENDFHFKHTDDKKMAEKLKDLDF